MRRAAFTMLVKRLEDAGVLYACQTVQDHDTTAALPQAAIVKKWWAMMADLMETNPDSSPVQKELVEVFHMD